MDERDRELVASAAEAASLHMLMCVMMNAPYLERTRRARSDAFLAFEMGVLEYFHRAMVLPSTTMDMSQSFFELAIVYGNETYKSDAMTAIDFWQKIAVQSLMHDKRQLGFESVQRGVDENGERRPGHAPILFYCEAMGVEFSDLVGSFAVEG